MYDYGQLSLSEAFERSILRKKDGRLSVLIVWHCKGLGSANKGLGSANGVVFGDQLKIQAVLCLRE